MQKLLGAIRFCAVDRRRRASPRTPCRRPIASSVRALLLGREGGRSRAAMIPCTVSGSGSCSGPTLLGQHAHVLLCIEGVPARVRASSARLRVRQDGARPSRAADQQLRSPRSVERRHESRVVTFELSTAPALPPLEKLRDARSQRTRIGHPAPPVDEVIDEVEEAVIGEMQVLEDEHQRPFAPPAPSKNRRQAANDSFHRSEPGSISSPDPCAAPAGDPRRQTETSAASGMTVSTRLLHHLHGDVLGRVGFENR